MINKQIRKWPKACVFLLLAVYMPFGLPSLPKPSTALEIDPYDTLLIYNDEEQKIAIILTTMAKNNVVALLFKKDMLERLGRDVNRVHPVRFLGAVFSNPHLVDCMREIYSSYFKWNGFMSGFSERFRQELKANNVYPYLSGFSKSLGINRQELQAYIQRGDLEGLVLFLIDKKKR